MESCQLLATRSTRFDRPDGDLWAVPTAPRAANQRFFPMGRIESTRRPRTIARLGPDDSVPSHARPGRDLRRDGSTDCAEPAIRLRPGRVRKPQWRARTKLPAL